MNGELAPYRGLAPFGDSDADALFFFGRDREREVIVANLMASRLTVLYGETGVGKSSVLHAGVARHLRELSATAVVVFDSWQDDPAGRLEREIADAGGVETAGSLADTIDRCTTRLGGELYVILDQLEEYFLYQEGEEGPGTLALELPEAVRRPGLRASFLLSLREDAVARLDRFKGRIPNLFGNYLRLDHLDREAARQAILGPLERYAELAGPDARVEIEPPLVDAVLDDVAAGRVALGQGRRDVVVSSNGRARVETPYLQLVMQQLWETARRSGLRELRVATLRELGGAEQIVRDHLEGALEELSPKQQDLAAEMFDHLVTPSGTKIAHAASDLARYGRVDEPTLAPVLAELVEQRIVRPLSDEAGAPRYEIYHDVLAEAVLAWRTAHEARRELVQERENAARRHRRLLAVIGVGAVLLAAMTVVTIFALTQRSEARSQARRAHAGELAARATSALPSDPELSLALAVRSARLLRTSADEEVLRQALLQQRELAILPSTGPVRSAVFSPNGRLVATASDDGTARLFRTSTGQPVSVLRTPGHVLASAFSPDGRRLLTAGSDGAARIWLVSSGEQVRVLRHGGAVTVAAFVAAGRYVVTSSRDGTVRLWRGDTGKPVHTMRVGKPVEGVAVSPDASLLVAMSTGHRFRARVYDPRIGKLLYKLAETGITTAAFSPNGRLIVTGSLDHKAAIWDAQTGQRLHWLIDAKQAVTSASFGPKGRLVVTASEDGATRVWNAATGRRLFLLLDHTLPVLSASWSPNGRWFVTTSEDGSARVWQASSGRLQAKLLGHGDTVLGSSFNRDGSRVVTASTDGTARIWNAGTAPELHLLASVGHSLRSASWSPDGKLVALAGADGVVRVVDQHGRVLRAFRQEPPVAGARFSADGRLLVTAGGEVVHVRRASDGRELRRIQQLALIEGLSVSSDGKLLVIAGRDGRARVWAISSGKLVRTFRQPSPMTATAFSPDSRLVVGAGANGVGRIWDVRTGRLVTELRRHRGEITAAAFSPDGRKVVTVSRDHDMRIWSVATGTTLRLVHAHFGPIFGVAFSPDGRSIVTAGPITAGVWEGGTGRFLLYLRGHSEPLTDATFSPDGRTILTVSRDGTARVYACDECGGIDELLRVAEARLGRIAAPLSPVDRRRFLHE